MCGIVGIVNYREDISNQNSMIRNMARTITRRGPDEDGIYLEKHVNLAHKRLSIIDIENGKQTMSNKLDEFT